MVVIKGDYYGRDSKKYDYNSPPKVKHMPFLTNEQLF